MDYDTIDLRLRPSKRESKDLLKEQKRLMKIERNNERRNAYMSKKSKSTSSWFLKGR